MHRLVSLAVAVVTSGCVTMGTYEQKAGEAARLRADLDAEQARGTERARELEKRLAEQEAASAKLLERIGGLENDLTSKEADRAELERKANELLALNEELSKSSKKLAEAKAELEKKSADYEGLAKSLKAEISAGKIELSELRGKMTVKMKDKILFASGSATVGQEGLDALAKVAQAFKGIRGRIPRRGPHRQRAGGQERAVRQQLGALGRPLARGGEGAAGAGREPHRALGRRLRRVPPHRP